MKLQIFNFVALIVLFMGWLSCTSDLDNPNEIDDLNDLHTFKWDASQQQEEFRPVNLGKESSYFAIDDNIVSFAVPYLVGSQAIEHPGYNLWAILLIMAEGSDVTSLAPIITLAPGATITLIEDRTEKEVLAKQVDYTGIAEVGIYNFRHQIDFTVIVPDGSTVTYMCLAVAIGDVLPWGGNP
jgi:hypothetical protein